MTASTTNLIWIDLEMTGLDTENDQIIEIDYLKASRLGLDARNIGNVVRAAISSKRLSTITLTNSSWYHLG